MMQNLLVNVGEMFKGLWEQSGLSQGSWQNYVMLGIAVVLFYLAIVYLLTFAIKIIEKRLRASDKR